MVLCYFRKLVGEKPQNDFNYNNHSATFYLTFDMEIPFGNLSADSNPYSIAVQLMVEST